jgi:hypothetical protein
LAWDIIRASSRAARELQEFLPRLKRECSADEYEVYARGFAGAIHGINTALIDKAIASHPELRDRIEAELAQFGRLQKCGNFAALP